MRHLGACSMPFEGAWRKRGWGGGATSSGLEKVRRKRVLGVELPVTVHGLVCQGIAFDKRGEDEGVMMGSELIGSLAFLILRHFADRVIPCALVSINDTIIIQISLHFDDEVEFNIGGQCGQCGQCGQESLDSDTLLRKITVGGHGVFALGIMFYRKKIFDIKSRQIFFFCKKS